MKIMLPGLLTGCLKHGRRLEAYTPNENIEDKSGTEIKFGDQIWQKIMSHSSPFDVFRWRRVNRRFECLVRQRFEKIIYLDVTRHANLDLEHGHFHKSTSSQLLLRIEDHKAQLMVNEKWTLADVVRLWSALTALGKYALNVQLDAAVMELIVAGLSSMNLSRWYSFQCYLQAFNENEMERLHLHCSKCPQRREPFFPQLNEITIRLSIDDRSDHLDRLLDYAVLSSAVFNPDSVQLVRLRLICSSSSRSCCSSKTNRCTRRPENIFRRWVRAGELAEKYSQQYVKTN